MGFDIDREIEIRMVAEKMIVFYWILKTNRAPLIGNLKFELYKNYQESTSIFKYSSL